MLVASSSTASSSLPLAVHAFGVRLLTKSPPSLRAVGISPKVTFLRPQVNYDERVYYRHLLHDDRTRQEKSDFVFRFAQDSTPRDGQARRFSSDLRRQTSTYVVRCKALMPSYQAAKNPEWISGHGRQGANSADFFFLSLPLISFGDYSGKSG
ncbi:hypothetical protein SODALDRAFT_110367 [Sodiomyces alkalinus F11]|uniref:Uncharacterized protein n=1 Tax=Sodiomyces alkalinus (strain CBS 110278 / VKM F-3762 / F11) TaxID=1314773 RepID=A0A3N2Q2Q1_SODAK|nr:hypothetical protein SODALDRAFT_110367 [Sodiomyces alkalinus F11]ROT41041.1 hypothetical protein SODALDRAFT_110367 [Sodiomyces alkalinus F11]